MFEIESYEDLLAQLRAQYELTSGVMAIQSSDFCDDEVIFFLDRKLLTVAIPATYKSVAIISLFPYEEYNYISNFIDDLLINETSLWENSNTNSLDVFYALLNKYAQIILDYENSKLILKD